MEECCVTRSNTYSYGRVGHLFPEQSLKETVENRTLRMAISNLLSQARSREDEGIIELRATFYADMTSGQAIKLRDNGCRIWLLDTAMDEWFYNDFVDGKLIRIYEGVTQ